MATPSARSVRVAGVVLVVIGAGLTAGVGYLIAVISDAMRPGGAAGGTTFTGTPRDATFIYAILGCVVAFGVTSFVTGVWQIATGRRSLLLSALVLVLAIAAFALGLSFRSHG